MASPSFTSARPAEVSLALPRTARGLVTATCTVLVGLLLLLPVGAAAQVVMTAQIDDHTPTQAIVVLDPARYWGNAREARGERLAHAADLYRQGVAPVVIVTGTRRDIARQQDALARRGVPAGDVIGFTTGGDTVGVLRIVSGVMRDLGWSAATLVTDKAHSARAQSTASAFGMDAHLSPTTDGVGSTLTSEGVGRETAALLRFHALTRWTLPTIIH